MATTEAAATSAPTLQRALGRWDLTAFGLNIVIGGGIFLLPSLIASEVGNWSPLAVVLVGLAVLCVALSYAEVGSRFDRTGGPYLYTLAAFGSFVAFEVGWMSWFTRVASQASLFNGIALAVGFYAPGMKEGWPRIALIAGCVLALAVVNVRGIRQSAVLINTMTIAKLVPLVLFVLIGLFFVDWSRLAPLPTLGAAQIGAGALLLIYAYGGFETMGVPAGETLDPRRHLAFAMVTTVVTAALIMTLALIVTMTTLPDVTQSTTPVADAAAAFIGPLGALMIGIGSILAMTGNTAGSMLTASRFLFALGESDAIPRYFARIHPKYRTPANAIWFSAAIALVLAVSGSFALLLLASAVARLVTYAGVSAAALMLRHPRFAGRVQPATFLLPLGPTVPLLGVLVSLAILGGATGQQLAVGGAALAAGAVLFALTAWRRTVRDQHGIADDPRANR